MFLQLIAGLSLLEVVIAASCDKSFSSSFGTLGSPDYLTRSEYADNQYCTYDIEVSYSFTKPAIRLTWSTFDIKGKMPSCSEDYVEIFIGCSKYSIGKYCSSSMPFNVYSPDNCLSLSFKSDSSGAGRGFSATYSAVSKSSVSSYLPGSCSGTRTMYSKAGVINSPNWPSKYPSLKDCYWKIEVGSGKGIKIAFMDFYLETDFGYSCDDDKVKVKGGSKYQSYDSSSTIKGSMCGNKIPFSFTSTKERIYIRFKSDSFTEERGFVAGYVVYDSKEGSSGGSSSVVVGIVVAIIVLLVFAGCIYYVFVYRRRLARQQAGRQQAMMVVNHPPPPPQPGYGPPPPAGYGPTPPVGYAPPPPAGAAPPPQPGYAPPPSYSQVMAAPYPQQGAPGPYPPAPQGGAPPYPPGEPGGAPAYPPGQYGGPAPYPPGPPAGELPHPTAPAGGAPYPPQ